MKNKLLLAAPLLAMLFLAGCMNGGFPKDAYIQGGHQKVVTPWGTMETIVDMAATGNAAKNISLPEQPVIKGASKGPVIK
jgi:hypothetical protein